MCAAETYTILIVFGYPYLYIYIYIYYIYIYIYQLQNRKGCRADPHSEVTNLLLVKSMLRNTAFHCLFILENIRNFFSFFRNFDWSYRSYHKLTRLDVQYCCSLGTDKQL